MGIKKIRLSAQLLALPFDHQSKCARDNERLSQNIRVTNHAQLCWRSVEKKWHIHE